ncbi:MAG: hypothetical protein ACYSWO_08360 [Planctomycetota bacterium]|jgi:hypothetical protein
MTESSFLRKLLRFSSESLDDLQWLDWKVFAIAVPATILLFLTVRRLLQASAEEEPVTEIPEHPHIIGARLVKRKQDQERAKDPKRGNRTDVQAKRGEHHNPEKAAERSERLNREIEQLNREAVQRKRIEERLSQKVSELTTHNEQLLQETAESKQTETQLRKEIAELMMCYEQLQSKAAESNDVEEALKLTTRFETGEVPRHIDGMRNKRLEQARGSNQSEEPLDADTLRAIADLIERIQGRSGQS